jgi:hypothetical protein
MCSCAGDAELGLEGAYSLADEINQLAAHISAATCRWLGLISEFDRGEGHIHYGFPTCADWLAWSCSLSRGTAREHVRVARALDDLPRVRASFAAGKLSFSKARALTRIATAENEQYLLMLAEHETAAQLEQTVRGYRRTTAVALDEAEAARERRFLSCGWDDDGFLNIRGRLSAEEGALVMQALEIARETLRAEARTPNGQSDVSAETSEPAATRADALALMAETLVSGGPATRPAGARAELVVHVDADSLVDDGSPDGACHIEGAAGLHPETARRLGCDAGLVRIIERDGRPLSVGRKTRTISPALRRALNSRDQGRCRFPGCTRTRGVEGHHIKHWAHGGKTDLSNLVSLCSTHHRAVHERGFTVDPDGKTFVFRNQHGRKIPNVPRSLGGHEGRMRRANKVHAPDIGPTTCMPISRGERVDHAGAVDGLLQADGYFDEPPWGKPPARPEPPEGPAPP